MVYVFLTSFLSHIFSYFTKVETAKNISNLQFDLLTFNLPFYHERFPNVLITVFSVVT